MNKLPNLLKEQFYYTLAVASSMLSSILISIFGTRLLTINEYGLLALVKPLIVILSSFFGFGLFQSFLHWRWRKEINKSKLIQTTFGGILYSSIAFSILLLIILSLVLKDRNEFININGYLCLLVMCVTYMQNNEMINLYRVENLRKKFASITILRSFFQVIFISGFLSITRKYTAYIYGLCISEALVYTFLVKEIGFYKPKIDIKLLKDLTKFGFPNALVICGTFLLTFTDRYMMYFFSANTTDIGIYDVNYLIAGGFITFISRPVNIYIQPFITKLFYKEGIESAIFSLKKFEKIFLSVLFLITLFTIFFKSYIIEFFFTASYSNKSIIIIPLSISFLINGLGITYRTFLNIQGKNRINGISISIAILFNIIINYFLIPKFGILGASLSTCFCSFLEYYILLISSKSYKHSLIFNLLVIFSIAILTIFGIIIN